MTRSVATGPMTAGDPRSIAERVPPRAGTVPTVGRRRVGRPAGHR
ncbi:hypothetical protein [Micromonospora sp. WMMD714]|nr:hypothetical protein [Micromonospora sp. WMMD714]WFE65565.1 hypothetical protein O7625_20740 [Micromonospora sp. WMMD714]